MPIPTKVGLLAFTIYLCVFSKVIHAQLTRVQLTNSLIPANQSSSPSQDSTSNIQASAISLSGQLEPNSTQGMKSTAENKSIYQSTSEARYPPNLYGSLTLYDLAYKIHYKDRSPPIQNNSVDSSTTSDHNGNKIMNQSQLASLNTEMEAMKDNLSTFSFLQRNTDIISNRSNAIEDSSLSKLDSNPFDEREQINSTYNQIVSNFKQQLTKQLDNSN